MSGLLGAKKVSVSNTAPVVGSVRFQTSALGKPIAVALGTVRIPDNLLWYNNFVATAHTETSESGGKGGAGGSSTTNTTYTYSAGILFGLCEGEVAAVNTLWRGEERIVTQQPKTDVVSVTEVKTVAANGQVTVDHAADYVATTSVQFAGADLFDSTPSYPYLAQIPGGGETDYAYAVLNNDGVYTFNEQFVGSNVSITYQYKNYANNTALAQVGLTLFGGTYSQVPFSFITTNYPSEALGYQGIAYVASSSYPLGDSATINNHNFEVETTQAHGALTSLAKTFTAATPTFTSVAHGFEDGRCVRLTTTGALPYGLLTGFNYYVINATANTFQLVKYLGSTTAETFSGAGTGTHTATPWVPDVLVSDAMNELLTNANWGVGFPAAQIGSLTQFESYCLASGSWVSPSWLEPEQASDILERLAVIGYCGLVFSENTLKFVPYADSAITGNGETFTPVNTVRYALVDDDFVRGSEDPISVQRVDPADAFNQVNVKINDRAKDYNENTLSAEDMASIDQVGLRPASTFSLLEICDPALGKWVAFLILLRLQAVRNKYSFELPAQYLLLEPMDLVSLTESSGTGLDGEVVRIIEIEEDGETGVLSIVAENFPQGSATSVNYPVQNPSGYVPNFNVSPGDVSSPIIFDAPAQFTTNVNSLWIALAGESENWGGCTVWVSFDGSNYQQVGTFSGRSRYGYLTAPLPVADDPDITNTVEVDMAVSRGDVLSSTQADCDKFLTLCWVGGELISYQDATLVSGYEYSLGTRLRRGVYDTAIGYEHPIGTGFVRLDTASGSIFEYNYNDPSKIGQVIYLKFLSFNVYGTANQSLSEVKAYQYRINGPIGVPEMPIIRGLELFEGGQDDEFTGRGPKFVWDEVSATAAYQLGKAPPRLNVVGGGAAGSGQLDPFFKGYLVKMYSVDDSVNIGAIATLLREEVVTVPYYEYTWEKNAEDQARLAGTATALPIRDVWIQVYAMGGLGQLSPLPAQMAVTNPVIAFSNLTATASFNSVTFDYDLPLETDWDGAHFYISESAGFTPSTANLVYDGVDNHVVIGGLKSSTTYYWRATIDDVFGQSDYTAEASFTTPPSINQNIDGPNSGSYDLTAVGVTGKISLGATYIPNYPSSLPAQLNMKLTASVTCGGSAENALASWNVMLVTSTLSAPGTISIAHASGSNYTATGVGTSFTSYAANDWIYFGAGKAAFKVVSVTNDTTMTVRMLLAANVPAYTISGATYTAYRGDEITSFTPSSGVLALAANGFGILYAPSSKLLTASGYTGVFVVAGCTTLGGAAMTATNSVVEAGWSIGA